MVGYENLFRLIDEQNPKAVAHFAVNEPLSEQGEQSTSLKTSQ